MPKEFTWSSLLVAALAAFLLAFLLAGVGEFEPFGPIFNEKGVGVIAVLFSGIIVALGLIVLPNLAAWLLFGFLLLAFAISDKALSLYDLPAATVGMTVAFGAGALAAVLGNLFFGKAPIPAD